MTVNIITDFGAVGDGITDDTLAIQAALNSCKSVFIPKPSNYFRTTAPLVTAIDGQIICGDNPLYNHIKSAPSHTGTILRLAHAKCEVFGFGMELTNSANTGIHAYSAWANIHDMQIVPSNAVTGTAVLFTNIDPVTSAVIAGSGYHTVERNIFGSTSFGLLRGVDTSSTAIGIHGLRTINNHFFADYPQSFQNGSGDIFAHNMCQSASGTYAVPAGFCVDIGANTVAESIYANFFERYSFGAYIRATSTGSANIANFWGNILDGTTTQVHSNGATNYSIRF